MFLFLSFSNLIKRLNATSFLKKIKYGNIFICNLVIKNGVFGVDILINFVLKNFFVSVFKCLFMILYCLNF